MRVAFDVKGTIEGPYHDKVMALLKAFEAIGYDITVWSNFGPWAKETVEKYELNAEYMTKMSKSDFRVMDGKQFNFAVEDDRTQTWLGADKIIFVDEIPDDVVEFAIQLTRQLKAG